MKKKDLIHYCGAAGIFIVVILLLMYLAKNSIPLENKDIFVSIVGTLNASLAVVIYSILGKNPKTEASWMLFFLIIIYTRT